MESLAVLEKKVSLLIAKVKELKSENSKLTQKNEQLSQKLDSMKSSVQVNAKNYDEEREKTKVFVDTLIRSIDSLIGEQQP